MVWKKAFFPLPLGERLCSPLVFRVYCFGRLLSSKLPVFLVLCASFWVFYAISMQNNAFGCINLQHSPHRYRRGLCAVFLLFARLFGGVPLRGKAPADELAVNAGL